MIHLSWDSDFFSKKIFQLSICEELFSNEIPVVKSCEADLIYIFASTPSKEQRMKLEEAGAKLYDKKVTYVKKISTAVDTKFTVDFVSIVTLNPSVEAMAYQSGEFSRFNLDPKLSNSFKKLYYAWIAKSVQREIADEVIVAKKGKEEVGLITLKVKEKIGKIGLIAVDEKFRGLKIGSQLLAKAELWFAEKKVETCEVVTQLDNLPACSLYEKNKFVQTKLEFIYHYWRS